MSNYRYSLAWLILMFLCSGMLYGQETSVVNRFVISGTAYLPECERTAEYDALWQVTADAETADLSGFRLKAETTVNAKATGLSQNDTFADDYQLAVNRLWLRATTAPAELRVGLQRLNFGTAQILRPLQWFDRLKPLDTMESTQGVKALIGRYYFANNANLWAWGILSENSLKGIEYIPSANDKVEWGGRLELPIGKASLGINAHHRLLETSAFSTATEEWRGGLDLRLDYIMGLWAEAGFSHFTDTTQSNTAALTIGSDYTISVGNGIYTMCETNLSNSSDNSLSHTQNTAITSALMVDYPLGLLDKVVYLGIYDFKTSYYTHTLLWRRTYDHLNAELSFTADHGQRSNAMNGRSAKLLLGYSL